MPGRRSRTMELQIRSSLRLQAKSSPLDNLSTARNRWWRA